MVTVLKGKGEEQVEGLRGKLFSALDSLFFNPSAQFGCLCVKIPFSIHA